MRWQAVLILCLTIPVLGPSVGSGQDLDPGSRRDVAAEVRAIFAAKCTACHGSDLPKPRGRFGYVLDLSRVANNREMVVPSHPDESELWILIERNEMPPPDSPRGAMTDREKAVVREWIASGAPDVSPSQPGVSRVPTPEGSLHPDAPSSATSISMLARTIRWLGKFHLLLLHFPIALVLVAGVGETRSVWLRSLSPSEFVRFCLLLAALAAVPTVVLGWLHAEAGNGVGSPQLLLTHRWIGTTTGLWLLATALLSERDVRRGSRSRWVQLLIIVGILLTSFTAHLGGTLEHRPDFFDW